MAPPHAGFLRCFQHTGFTVVQKILDPTTATVSVIFSLKIQFVFSNHCLFVCFLKHTKSVFFYIYLLPGPSTLLSVLLFHQSLMPPLIPSQAIRRKWPLRSAANATDQLSLNFIYTVRLNLSIFDAFCWLTFRRKRRVWASRVWPSGGRVTVLSN